MFSEAFDLFSLFLFEKDSMNAINYGTFCMFHYFEIMTKAIEKAIADMNENLYVMLLPK